MKDKRSDAIDRIFRHFNNVISELQVQASNTEEVHIWTFKISVINNITVVPPTF
jgi:hypothetical protein